MVTPAGTAGHPARGRGHRRHRRRQRPVAATRRGREFNPVPLSKMPRKGYGVQSLPISAGSSTPSGRSAKARRSCGRRPGLVGLVIPAIMASAERITPTFSIPRRSPTVDRRCMFGGLWNTRNPRSSYNTSRGSFDSKYRRTPPASLMKSIIASSPTLRLGGFPARRRESPEHNVSCGRPDAGESRRLVL